MGKMSWYHCTWYQAQYEDDYNLIGLVQAKLHKCFEDELGCAERLCKDSSELNPWCQLAHW